MKILTACFLISIFLAPPLRAEDTPNPELEAAKAKIAWLEQKLAATELKTRACFDIYGADMKLNQLAQQEPKTAQQEPAKAKTDTPAK